MSVSQDSLPAVDGLSDESLVQRLRAGDLPAGEMLANRYHLPLLRYLQRLSGSPHLGEELLQATWLSALEHLDRFDARSVNGGFRAWIFRIATNKAADAWRARGRESSMKQALHGLGGDEAPSASARLEGIEHRQRLQRAIDLLPESQRQVLMLRYYSDMKFAEIAHVLGCPLNTALGRMHKAMLRLKQLLNE